MLAHARRAAAAAALAFTAGASCDAPPPPPPPPRAPPPPPPRAPPPPLAASVLDLIGNTPLLELRSLSDATGCRILVKCEQFTPGGSVKDRAALSIVRAAEASGALAPGGAIVEATGGNTGIALALIAAQRGYRCFLTMPPTTSPEKVALARALGATVEVCAAVAFGEPEHYYARAAAIAAERGAVWTDQFENAANRAAHFDTTGPEIWAQAGGRVDALALGAGTGGTIGGLATFLRARNPALRVFLIDPPGSALAAYVTRGELVASPGPTINEGIGLARITNNFAAAFPVEAAFQGVDAEVVDMAHFLLRREGLHVGPSAALNVIAAVKAARLLGPGHTVVTILCDGGARYAAKMAPDALAARGLAVSPAVLAGALPVLS
jgi:cysteine synthase A